MKKQSTMSGTSRHYKQYNETDRNFSGTSRVWKMSIFIYNKEMTGLENDLKASRVFKNAK